MDDSYVENPNICNSDKEGLVSREKPTKFMRISIFVSISLIVLSVVIGSTFAHINYFSSQNASTDKAEISSLDQVISFESWKVRFSKTYSTKEEESKRKLIFEATVQKMIGHNEKHDNGLVRHRHGLNQFSDLTTEEFRNRNHGKLQR